MIYKQTYAGKFKLNVLNDMKTTGTSYSMTANHFEVSKIRTIADFINSRTTIRRS
ncbi:hypothetical protein [Turicibacter bilis]|uniref:Transposase n=1 Tax=Turicibacter bilis TaxID=2735723 RepID=A0ABY5JHU9_9FIRM|nr:hypothetical protein [Turicibacter bilis]MBS3199755.1 hypothetical protein [Turicibacter bilis]UUF06267.1 hypothetical protein J0J69_01360 [Turicibacter bilis]